ncbi:YggT family protein [Lactobacillus sp. Sy-1]|uniref:YggT family protein n=1 Tax=Lactobacillus sp. Sy-1 TaxID=2109645 RepID=UPI001C565AFC|nr:YggT family protein [Lactobacillus sp. Sy-1]MBW1605417.1 YggT family protein [Lactobacillus sp. Sy-1]
MLGTIIDLIFFVLNRLISLYMIMIAIYCLLNWLPNAAYSKFGQFISRFVTPFLRLFSFARIGMVDVSPIIALILLQVLQSILVKIELLVLNLL